MNVFNFVRGVIASACLMALLTGWSAAEAKKLTASGKAGPVVSVTNMSPEGDFKHEVALVRRFDKDLCSDPIFGALDVDTVNFSDYERGGAGSQRGYRTFTHANGDKIFSTYEGVTRVERMDNGRAGYVFEGKWRYIGGTGKFQGLTGNGTYKGRLGPNGTTYEWEGTYELAKSAKASGNQ